MKNHNEQRKINFFSAAESTAEQEYLGNMASKGWFLKSRKSCVYTFEKGEPQIQKYAVGLFPKMRSASEGLTAEMLEYIDYCAAAGWKYICTWKNESIFVAQDVNGPPLMTDEREELRLAERDIAGEAAVLGIAFPLFLNALLRISGERFVSMITDGMSVLVIPLLVIGILVAFLYIAVYGVWIKTQKSRLRKGKRLCYFSLKQSKRIQKPMTVLALIFPFWVIFNIIMLGMQQKYSEMRTILLSTLMVAEVLVVVYLFLTRDKPSSQWIVKIASLFVVGVFTLFLLWANVESGGVDFTQSSCSVFAGQTDLLCGFADNVSFDKVTVFETHLDFLREAFLKSEDYPFSRTPVYDPDWEADTVTTPNGAIFILYDDSVVYLPKSIEVDKKFISSVRYIVDTPS